MLQTRSDALVVVMKNTAAGGGAAVVITNSGGMYAMQSGAWAVSSTILNSSNLFVTVMNSMQLVGPQSTTILNSSELAVTLLNSSNLWANVSATLLNSSNLETSISNSAGWVVSIANTGGWTMVVEQNTASGAATTSVASTIGCIVLSAANPLRQDLSIYNHSSKPMYIKLGSGATATDFTLLMVSSSYFELQNPVYPGIITGVWTSANGVALITETT